MPLTLDDGAPDPLMRKLAVAHAFTDADRAVLASVCRPVRRIEARRDIIRHGDRPNNVHLVLDGFAYRYKMLPDGHRQIVAVLMPGDFCDLHVAILGRMDHAIATLTACTMVDIPAAAIRTLTEERPRLARALWWATLVDEGVLREWLTGLGQREAPERMAHLFCELHVRLGWVGLADGDAYDLPLTQVDLADVLGLTSVHVNRTLRDLRAAGLIELKRRRLAIPDVARLRAFCAFDPTYLHAEARETEDAR